uniref:Uncharacterized protein n=1 Tax=Globisporangium ultimum (strain ATCC 200006 / CBS 805.95 / DAOM BR144) TaxID=431595 RepID=K3X0T8_GLOUD
MLCLASVALLAVQALSAVRALGTNYDHNGKTTYCWHILQPPKNTKLNETNRVDGFSGTEGCPITMTVKLSSYQVQPFETVNVTWTVSADFAQPSKVNMTKVVYGPDAMGAPAQIVHSNVHSCEFGTGCDPFFDGSQLIHLTTNKIANFTDNFVTFTDVIKFSKTGDYSILAHIIMPESNASQRFDFAVYAELTVQDTTEAPVVATEAPDPVVINTSSGSLSSSATIGIIVGGVVVVIALIVMTIIYRRRRVSNNSLSPGTSYMAPPAYDASLQLLANSKNCQDHKQSECGTDITMSAGFQSAYSGPAGARPSQNLDGTGGSNASGSSYSSYDVINRESQMDGSRGGSTARGPSGVYRDTSASSSVNPRGSAEAVATAARPRRVDSEVEL